MITLKRVQVSDVYQLKIIKENAFEGEFKRLGFKPKEMISEDWHKDMMKKSIYYSIIHNENIIGGVNIFKFDEGYYLCSLFIESKLQNKGLGSQAVSQLEGLHNDRKKWQLETPSSSLLNHHFYEKLGYQYVNDMIPEEAPKGFSLRVYEKIVK